MARFCEKHMARATLTLKSYRDGTEYDLCATCEKELSEILYGKSKFSDNGIKLIDDAIDDLKPGQSQVFESADELIKELNKVDHGRKRVTGRPKTVKK